VSLRVEINIKELYQRLCERCKKKMLQYIKERLDEAMLERMILGSMEEKQEDRGEG